MIESLNPDTIKATRDLATIVYDSGNFPEQHLKTRRVYGHSGSRYIDEADREASISSIHMTMIRGIESGLPPMIGLYNIVWYNDRPCIWGDVALAMVQKSPTYESIAESFDPEKMVATCTMQRKGHAPITQEFSWDDAVRAKLSRLPHYQQFGPRMLKWRARSWVIRDLFADVLSGLSIAEEQRDIQEIKETGEEPIKTKIDNDPFTAQDTAKYEDVKAMVTQSIGDTAPVQALFETMRDEASGATVEKAQTRTVSEAPAPETVPHSVDEYHEEPEPPQDAEKVEESDPETETEEPIDLYEKIAAAEARHKKRTKAK